MRTQRNSNGEYTKEDPNLIEAHPSSKAKNSEAIATPEEPGPGLRDEQTDDTSKEKNAVVSADVDKLGLDT